MSVKRFRMDLELRDYYYDENDDGGNSEENENESENENENENEAENEAENGAENKNKIDENENDCISSQEVICSVCQMDDGILLCLGCEKEFVCDNCSYFYSQRVPLCAGCRPRHPDNNIDQSVIIEEQKPHAGMQVQPSKQPGSVQFLAPTPPMPNICFFCGKRGLTKRQCKLCYEGACDLCEYFHYTASDINVCDRHKFYCNNCQDHCHSTSMCVVQGCGGVTCPKESCGKFGNSIFFCGQHSKRCYFCATVLPLQSMISYLPKGFYIDKKNALFCCEVHHKLMNELGKEMKRRGLDYNRIEKVFLLMGNE